MSQGRTTNTLSLPVEPTADVSIAVVRTTDAVTDVLTDVIRRGAKDLLTKAVEAEVACWIEQHAHHTNADGHRQVVRNGYMSSRSILTGIGPIESVFATVRLRTKRTNGCGTRIACLTMVFKLMECASRNWRALNGSPLIADVLEGVRFVDGIKQRAA